MNVTIIGVRPCGCVTFWLAADGILDQDDLNAMQSVLDTGRSLVVTEREWSTDQLVTDCPHKSVAA